MQNNQNNQFSSNRFSDARFAVVFVSLCIVLAPTQGQAAGIVPAGTSQLSDSGTEASPAQWWFEGDYISPTGAKFVVGPLHKSWNQLTVALGQTFTPSDGLWVGQAHTYHNKLDVQAGAHVVVNGSANCGQGSISYSSHYNRIQVSGPGALLDVTQNLAIGGGLHSENNYFGLSDGALAVVDSDRDGVGGFSLYNHWSYGNSWLELDGGSLLLYGDKTADFADGKGIVTSIKIWDVESASLQRVAYYNSTTWTATPYLDQLEVSFLDTAADAEAHGLSASYAGFTVVQNVPEPSVLVMLSLGLFVLKRRRV